MFVLDVGSLMVLYLEMLKFSHYPNAAVMSMYSKLNNLRTCLPRFWNSGQGGAEEIKGEKSDKIKGLK